MIKNLLGSDEDQEAKIEPQSEKKAEDALLRTEIDESNLPENPAETNEVQNFFEPAPQSPGAVEPPDLSKIPEMQNETANVLPVYDSEASKVIGESSDTSFQTDHQPQSTAETVRQTGLAWSAGIIFFGSVVFMMIFGWFFDLLFGSSPWGLVGGIILGAIIGFIQFFRISSQIFKK